jgi:hypothetical protein
MSGSWLVFFIKAGFSVEPQSIKDMLEMKTLKVAVEISLNFAFMPAPCLQFFCIS